MYKAIFLISACLLALSACTYEPVEIWLNPDHYDYKDWDNYWYSFVPYCEGGSGDYEYRYDYIPSGWRDYDEDDFSDARYQNYLFIPKNEDRGRYQIGLNVYDIEYEVEINVIVIIQIQVNTIKVSVRDEYDPYFYFGKIYDFEEEDIIKFPSWKKVNELIKDGDVDEIKEIVERVIDSDNDCDDKKAFLNGVLGRIEKFIGSRNDHLDDLEKQLKNLRKNLQDLESKLEKLIA